MNEELTKACIASCQKCAAQCEQCAVACSLSPHVNTLAKCLELAIYCADMCRLTSVFIQRGELHSIRFSSLCAEVCDICAQECEKYNDPACKRCALECRECAESCRRMSTRMIPTHVDTTTQIRESA